MHNLFISIQQNLELISKRNSMYQPVLILGKSPLRTPPPTKKFWFEKKKKKENAPAHILKTMKVIIDLLLGTLLWVLALDENA